MINLFNKKTSSCKSEQIIRNILHAEDDEWYWDPQVNKVETATEKARRELGRKESKRTKKEDKQNKKKQSKKRSLATSGKLYNDTNKQFVTYKYIYCNDV